VLEGDAGEVTGDDRDSRLYRVDLDDHTTTHPQPSLPRPPTAF
jgi:hypothetical protein